LRLAPSTANQTGERRTTLQLSNPAVLVPERRKPGRPRIYAFDELQPGEKLFIPGKTRDQVAASVAAAERRTGFAFRILWSPGGVCVWRLTADREEIENQARAARKARQYERTAFGGHGGETTKAHSGTNFFEHN
jgi:hypothetical protein